MLWLVMSITFTLHCVLHSKCSINHYHICHFATTVSPLEGVLMMQLQLLCLRWVGERCREDLRLKQCFEATADEMSDHSAKGVTWKCYCLFVHCMPSFPEICEHIHYIWIQTELSNLHYVASCVTAIAFSSARKSASVFPLLYNKCHIYSSGNDLWWVSVLEKLSVNWFPVRINTFDLKLSLVFLCLNYKP